MCPGILNNELGIGLLEILHKVGMSKERNVTSVYQGCLYVLLSPLGSRCAPGRSSVSLSM